MMPACSGSGLNSKNTILMSLGWRFGDHFTTTEAQAQLAAYFAGESSQFSQCRST